MKRWIVFVLFVVFSLSVLQEATDAGCLVNEDASNCCICLCHTPTLGSAPTIQSAVSPIPQHYVRLDPQFQEQLIVKAIFIPPKVLA